MSDYAAVKFVIIIIIFAHVSCSNIGLDASTKHINERDNKAQNKLAPTVTLDKPKILLIIKIIRNTPYDIRLQRQYMSIKAVNFK